MANFGIGLGAFTQGLSHGMGVGKELDRARKDQQFDKFRQDTMAESKQAYESDKAAGKPVGELYDYYMKHSAPKFRNFLLEQGDTDRAMVWDKWLKDDKVQRGMQSWSGMVKSFMLGDYDQALQSLADTYNNDGYFADGISVLGYQKTPAGGIVASLQDSTGRVFEQQFDNIEDVVRTGVMAMSPDQVFEYGSQLRASNDAIRAEDRKAENKFQSQAALLQLKAALDLELAQAKHNRGLEASSQYRKPPTPQEQVRMILSKLHELHAFDKAWKALTPAEQAKQAWDSYHAIQAGQAGAPGVVPPPGTESPGDATGLPLLTEDGIIQF